MPEFLFEIFCEEIPARMQVKAGRDLESALVAGLKKAGVAVDTPRHWVGPRRLGFTADIPLASPDVSEERKGPRVGSPEQALAGFMRGAGLTDISQAEIRSDKKGEHYVAIIEKPGQASADILKALIPDVMNNFPWPKSMKSGASNFRWVRPLQSLICLLDGEIIPVQAGGITAGNTTEGHRRHGRGPFTVKTYPDYKKALETTGHVVLGFEDRKAKILNDARAACAAAGVVLVEDEGLLAEVAGLAEWPVIILGNMDPSFLELPGEVIRLSMKTHQKYFTVKNKDGSLAPHFVVVANQAAPDGGKAIAAGNSRVLSARLADAQFFQSEDAKKNLIDYYEKLDTVVFHKKLGSIKDKAERVAALARELAPKVGADPDLAEQAAKLAKCDLVTNMVVEFTSLQGQIGRLMYEHENGLSPAPSDLRFATPTSPAEAVEENSAPPLVGELGAKRSEGAARSAVDHISIATAIEDHYRPQGPSDTVPRNPVAVAVALADKLDTLVGFWAIDEKPTGSKDPYALRRAALGVVRIILENGVRLNFEQTLVSFEAYLKQELGNLLNGLTVTPGVGEVPQPGKELDVYMENIRHEQSHKTSILFNILNFTELKSSIDRSREQIDKFVTFNFSVKNLLAFIADRLKVHLRDQGVRHDLIDAVFALGEDDLVSIVNRVEALQSFLSTSDGENLLAGYKRAANILKAEDKKGDLPEGAPSKGTQPEETALYEALTAATPKIETALSSEDYAGAMTALAALRAPIDAFFDGVMVVSDNPEERQNRLRLLIAIRDTAKRIADFDKIDG